MLVVVILFSLVCLLQGAPITDNCQPYSSTTEGHLFLHKSDLTFGQRKVPEIIISCLATIIACAWTTMHPNIAAPNDSQWTLLKRRLVMTSYALLAPELILYWAITQRVAAKEIAQRYNKDILKINTPRLSSADRLREIVKLIPKKIRRLFEEAPPPTPEHPMQWTITHGFFLQMGGFMLCDKRTPIQTLSYDGTYGLHNLITLQVIDAPITTETDIKGRSKDDSISKTVVILQTSWFIVQCVSRWSAGLLVTQLEVVTLAFALLNSITYFVWWHKPQNVRALVCLEKIRGLDLVPEATSGPENPTNSRGPDTHLILPQSNDPMPAADVANIPVDDKAEDPEQTSMSPPPTYLPCQRVAHFMYKEQVPPWQFWALVCPIILFQTTARPISKMAIKPASMGENVLRVPMFYAGKLNQNQDNTIFAVSMFIGVIFGSVHLIPSWFLDFPSFSTMWIWRAAAFAITGLPVLSLAGSILTTDMRILEWKKIRIPDMKTTKHHAGTLLLTLFFLASPIYICARLVLISAAFLSLRNLSPDALITIEWISLVPHL